MGERVGSVPYCGLNILTRKTGKGAEQISVSRPSLNLRRMSSTGIRVPRITGLPSIICGLISIRPVTVIRFPQQTGYTGLAFRRSRLCAPGCPRPRDRRRLATVKTSSGGPAKSSAGIYPFAKRPSYSIRSKRCLTATIAPSLCECRIFA